MKQLKHILLTLVIVAGAVSLQAQSIVDLRLNEILLKNDNNFTDEYGRYVPWVEIFNTSYNSVNVGGCYLTNDTTGLAAAQKDKVALGQFKDKCYGIPKGDPKTLLEQRSCVVFFLDGDPTYGPFHVSFKPDATNYIALIGSDGKTLIDILEFPHYLRTKSVSFGCLEDGIVAENRANSVVKKNKRDTTIVDVRQELPFFTPGSNNKTISSESKADNLAKNDPHGIAMTVMAMLIVFSVLVIIFFVLKLFARFAKKEQAKKEDAQKTETKKAEPSKSGEPTNEELAAITMALHECMGGADEDEIAAVAMALYLHLYTTHDYESEVITFNNAAETSVWGQKHFNFKQSPERK